MNLTIGVDIDDVLYAYALNILAYWNRLNGTNLTLANYTSYRLWEVLGITREESDQLIIEFVKTNEAQNLAPIEGSVEAISALSKHYDLCIVTSRWTNSRQETRDWLKQFYGESFSQVHFLAELHTGYMEFSKAVFCRKNGIDFLIDDRFAIIKECPQEGVGGILFGEYFWDISPESPLEMPSGTVRARNWQEIFEAIQLVIEQKAISRS